MFLCIAKTLVAVKKRRVIHRPDYSESDENFSLVICLFISLYAHLVYVIIMHSDYAFFVSIAVLNLS